MPLPVDYEERVYAGVLGKIIGVYLGRPFENWTYERIMERLGEINYYVHEQLDVPLVVTDDDITGTFTFLRALPDNGNAPELTAAQIGRSWLNYLIEDETILWWGGLGNSTEHTAYLRLKAGIPAPESGSTTRNGQVVAEQIGAQIFIDGWAMVTPGDPELAADFAKRAGSVSHDGEAVYGAQVLAAMEAQAFVEPDIDKLIDTAVALIPDNSLIARMIADIRKWHAAEPDWRRAREKLAENYGYDRYGGNCHIIPNHGLIILSLLYGAGDFQKSLMIVNTSGWDTDCNSGNLGCLLGIKNGLRGIDAGPDWRGPAADRMYLPSADGGRGITDAVTEAYHIINVGRALAKEPPLAPKNGARFHFEMPGSVQGFMVEDDIAVRGTATLANVAGHSADGKRSLAVRYAGLAEGRVARVATPTFIPSSEIATYFEQRGYKLLCSPTLYSGQTVRARVVADAGNGVPMGVRLYVRIFGKDDQLELSQGPAIELAPGSDHVFTWTLDDTKGAPISGIGVEISGEQGATGAVYLDYLGWDGAPKVTLDRPAGGGLMWKRAWVNALDHRDRRTGTDAWPEPYRLLQNKGRGLLMQGTRDWLDYRVTARLKPHMCKAGGVAVRVQGLQRYYALLCDGERLRLIKTLDGDTVLADMAGGWTFGSAVELGLEIKGNALTGYVDGRAVIEASDSDHAFDGGGIALVCEEGRIGCDHVEVSPA